MESTEEEKYPRGFTWEKANRLLRRLADGEGIKSIIDRDKPGSRGIPSWEVLHIWINEIPEFKSKFEASRNLYYQHLAEEILSIADDGSNDYYKNDQGKKILKIDHVKRSQLRVDTRKWILSRVLPRMYGDQIGAPDSAKVSSDLVEIIKVVAEIARGKPVAEPVIEATVVEPTELVGACKAIPWKSGDTFNQHKYTSKD